MHVSCEVHNDQRSQLVSYPDFSHRPTQRSRPIHNFLKLLVPRNRGLRTIPLRFPLILLIARRRLLGGPFFHSEKVQHYTTVYIVMPLLGNLYFSTSRVPRFAPALNFPDRLKLAGSWATRGIIISPSNSPPQLAQIEI